MSNYWSAELSGIGPWDGKVISLPKDGQWSNHVPDKEIVLPIEVPVTVENDEGSMSAFRATFTKTEFVLVHCRDDGVLVYREINEYKRRLKQHD